MVVSGYRDFDFQNEIWVLEFDGETVLELFDFIAKIQPGMAAFPQFSREVRLRVDDKTNEILELTLHGKPIEPESTYRIAVTDFLARGGDGYAVLKKCTGFRVVPRPFTAAVTDYIQSLPQPIKVGREERFVRESGQ